MSHCVDLDLGFTPATNLLQLRRLNLAPGESADAPAAWVDIEDGGLSELMQRYERRGEGTYAYEAKRFDYAEVLGVTADGFVSDYPRLWRAED
ncbi:putative glycolipid-binding protein [compost metagenome]